MSLFTGRRALRQVTEDGILKRGTTVVVYCAAGGDWTSAAIRGVVARNLGRMKNGFANQGFAVTQVRGDVTVGSEGGTDGLSAGEDPCVRR